jgi:hypothetical protein
VLGTTTETETIERALDPAGFVARREATGGPGPRAMETMLRAARGELAASRQASAAVREAADRARTRREQECADVSAHVTR